MTPTVRVQMFDWQIGRLGYMRECKSARSGINLFCGDADSQCWHYKGAGFYWRVL